MKESVAIAKEANSKKESSSTRSGNSIQRLRNEPERQLGSLRDVIGNIRRDGGTPSAESIATELSGMHSAQRAPALLALQRTHGNRYVQRVVSGIQAKLKIGQPGDMYEREADRVADAVMRMPEPEVQRQAEEEEKKKEEEKLIQTKPLSAQITPLVQRQAEEKEEEEEEEILQTKENPGQTPEVTPDFESRIQSLKGGGQPLPEANRGFMERRFGIDFSGVRLHADSDAAQMSGELNAEAFTYGRDIYFGAGRDSPGTLSGKRLLAHELTHVVQQQGMEGTIRCFPVDEDECPGYQPGEISTSRTASGHLDPDVTLPAPGRLLIADFGVGRQGVKPSTQAEPLLRSWLSTFESDNSYRLSIAGYSDCVGSDSVNTRIRHGRAEQVERLLGPGAHSRVTFRGMRGLGDYVTNNNTIGNRARNRGVVIEFNRQAPTPTPPTPPPSSPSTPQYICGPDITAPLTSVFRRIRSTFASSLWTDTQRDHCCACIVGEYLLCNPTMAWDITDLYLPNTTWLYDGRTFNRHCGIPATGTPGTRSIENERTSPCGNSVRVNNKCFLAGTVNYGTFGIMCKLCHDYALRMQQHRIPPVLRLLLNPVLPPVLPPVLNPSWFTEGSMSRLIGLWKIIGRDDPTPPTNWALATYRGGPSGVSGTENRGRCTGRCRIPYSERGTAFDFVWEPHKPR